MRLLYKDCQNCLSRYTYQASGEGCQDPVNDSAYCPRCKTRVVEALRQVEKTAEWTFVPVEGEEKERALAMRAHKKGHPDTLMGVPVFRYGGSLFRMKDGKVVVSMRTDIVEVNGCDYFIREWTGNSEPVKVERRGLRDLKTGEVRLTSR